MFSAKKAVTLQKQDQDASSTTEKLPMVVTNEKSAFGEISSDSDSNLSSSSELSSDLDSDSELYPGERQITEEICRLKDKIEKDSNTIPFRVTEYFANKYPTLLGSNFTASSFPIEQQVDAERLSTEISDSKPVIPHS